MPNEGSRKSINVVKTEFPPDPPEIFRVEALAQGVVNVTWSHPWRTGGRLRRFLIFTQVISTNLITTNTSLVEKSPYEYPVRNYQAEYNGQLHLMPSTIYNITIIVETIGNARSPEKFSQVKTPSATEFVKDPTLETSNEDSTILLHIPAIVNDTKNSVTHVIVIGSEPCDNYTKASPLHYAKANIGISEIAWRAATFPVSISEFD